MTPNPPVPAGRRRPTRWGSIALLSGAAGLLAAADVFPSPLQAILVAALVLLGPGAVVRNWITVAPATGAVLVPVVGVSTIILLTTLLAALDAWSPFGLLLGLSAAVVVGGLSRWTVPAVARRSAATSAAAS